MDQQKLQRILNFNKENRGEITQACMNFYNYIGRQQPAVITDIQAMAQIIFARNQYKILHIPMKSKEIGAFQLRLNNASYLVLNTSKSLANNNFAAAHELYHVLVQKQKADFDHAEVYLNNYEENRDEMMANAFAGNILMPVEDFNSTAYMLKRNKRTKERNKTRYIQELSLILTLMSYYKTTYMSVVIRCFENGILDVEDEELRTILLKNNSEEKQKKLFEQIARYFGETSILEATKSDDFEALYQEAEDTARENVKHGWITEDDLNYRLKGMRDAYLYVKGDV